MLGGQKILAVVPARSGSKGLPDKNMRTLHGVSLIGWAGEVLKWLPDVDAKVISTDSPRYAEEGSRYGLEAPFLRSAELSGDLAGAIETMQHAVEECEGYYGHRFDIALIVQPTSPFRTSDDIVRTARCLIDSNADSAVTVSRLDAKSHPWNILRINQGRLLYAHEEGPRVQSRQAFKGEYYWKNGLCYAVSRSSLMEHSRIFSENTLPVIIDRPVANIDVEMDLEWARFLIDRFYTGSDEGTPIPQEWPISQEQPG